MNNKYVLGSLFQRTLIKLALVWTQSYSTSVACFWFIMSGASSAESFFLLATKIDYDKKGTSIAGDDYADAWV